jgi:hypothetical protein
MKKIIAIISIIVAMAWLLISVAVLNFTWLTWQYWVFVFPVCCAAGSVFAYLWMKD